VKTARRSKPSARKTAKTRTVRRAAARRSQPARRTRAGISFPADVDDLRGLGPESGGQSGDIEGLSRAELADSESVEELAEEGQAFEAGIVDAVENAPEGELRAREVPEDDVPQEYLDED
jgi:hypothetical protein